MFTHCGEMPSLKQNSNKMAFSCEKRSRHYLGYKMENSASDRAAWTKCC